MDPVVPTNPQETLRRAQRVEVVALRAVELLVQRIRGRGLLGVERGRGRLQRVAARRERFEPGTNMRAWTFVILRNAYLTELRRNRFRGDYDEAAAERDGDPERAQVPDDVVQRPLLRPAQPPIGGEERARGS